MRNIDTEITIDAPVEVVWMTFMDFASYEDWNPFMRIEGEIIVGSKLKLSIFLNGKESKFRPKITILEDQRKLEWKGKLAHKNVFSGNHYFHFIPTGEGQTLFKHGEQFSGLFSRAIFKKIGADTEKGFNEFNEALKERAEDNVI